jgi:hypothetical protein
MRKLYVDTNVSVEHTVSYFRAEVCPRYLPTSLRNVIFQNSNTAIFISIRFSQSNLCCIRKRDEVTGELRKLHNEELHNLYSSPDIIRQVKSRRMRWAGYVARMGEERKCTRESPKERDHLEDQGVGGKWDQNGSSGDWLGGCGFDSTVSGQGPVGGLL